jgi:uncharacterized membrane protein
MSPDSGLDYTIQYYNGESSFAEGVKVSVTEGAITSNIGATMKAVAKPVNTELPNVTGALAVGQTLSVRPGHGRVVRSLGSPTNGCVRAARSRVRLPAATRLSSPMKSHPHP